MKGRTRGVILLMAAVVAGCSSSGSARVARPSHSPAPSQQSASYPRCGKDARFSLKMLQPISPLTGEHAFIVQLMYVGSSRCTIEGYPRVAFFAPDGTRLAFYSRHSAGQYVTHRRPTPVNLESGDSFFMAIAKYRCDVHTVKTAKYAELRPPCADKPVRVDLGSVATFDFCPVATSEVVYLSPVEGSETRLFQQ